MYNWTMLVFSLVGFMLVGSTLSFSPLSNANKACALCSNHDSGRSYGQTRMEAVNFSRRESLERLSQVALGGLASEVFITKEAAVASGGATAGGPYLLSAKQRYNDRVITGLREFVSLGDSLESGSLDKVTAFFNGEDVGSWKDASAAGYLLANAFRRNSTAPPDSLPAVKKWKAFASEVDAMKKAIKKKQKSGTKAAYESALAALDGYLEEVELQL